MYSPVQNAQSADLFNFDPPLEYDKDRVFKAFSKTVPNKMNLAEFQLMCYALFKNDVGHRIVMEPTKTRELFEIFDRNCDGFICKKEFDFVWEKWLTVIVRPITCLLIVDLQNDFISGSLSLLNCPAKQDGAEVVEPINELLQSCNFDVVAYTMDWHPKNHVSFYDNLHKREIHPFSPKKADEAQMYDTVIFRGPNDKLMKQKLWPVHCVMNSEGAKLHADLKLPKGAIKILKGRDPNVDSYSAFWDNARISQTPLHEKLQSLGVTDIFVCGLAWDFCVGFTALDALEHGYRTYVVEDCTRAISMADMEKRRTEIIKNYGILVRSREVQAMLRGIERRPQPAYKLGVELREEVPLVKIRRRSYSKGGKKGKKKGKK